MRMMPLSRWRRGTSSVPAITRTPSTSPEIRVPSRAFCLSKWVQSDHRCWVSRAGSSVLLLVAASLLAGCASASSLSGGASSAAGPTEEEVHADAPGTVPTGCILLVRGMTAPTSGQTPGTYTGAFLVLLVEDGQVRGEGGDFHSEGYDVRGHIGSTGTELQMNTPTEPTDWQPLPLVWIPERGTFEGWNRVRLAEMRDFSGGYIPSANSGCGSSEAAGPVGDR